MNKPQPQSNETRASRDGAFDRLMPPFRYDLISPIGLRYVADAYRLDCGVRAAFVCIETDGPFLARLGA